MSIKPGALVNATIAGVRMGERSHIRVTVETQDGELWVLPPHTEIELVAPAEWPPRPGDLWRDRDGDLWFARDLSDDGTAAMWSNNAGKGAFPFGSVTHKRLLAQYGPLTLVHREDADGGRS